MRPPEVPLRLLVKTLGRSDRRVRPGTWSLGEGRGTALVCGSCSRNEMYLETLTLPRDYAVELEFFPYVPDCLVTPEDAFSLRGSSEKMVTKAVSTRPGGRSQGPGAGLDPSVWVQASCPPAVTRLADGQAGTGTACRRWAWSCHRCSTANTELRPTRCQVGHLLRNPLCKGLMGHTLIRMRRQSSGSLVVYAVGVSRIGN